MFIEEIMKKIWSGPTAEHASLEAYYSKKSAEEVYRDLIEEINNTEELLQYKSGFFFYNLPDRGCDICNRDGTFVSCSFCDMISMNLKVTLMSSILRKKDTYLY